MQELQQMIFKSSSNLFNYLFSDFDGPSTLQPYFETKLLPSAVIRNILDRNNPFLCRR